MPNIHFFTLVRRAVAFMSFSFHTRLVGLESLFRGIYFFAVLLQLFSAVPSINVVMRRIRILQAFVQLALLSGYDIVIIPSQNHSKISYELSGFYVKI